MEVLKSNILDLMDRVDAVCITTNGFVKKNGENVMGRGVAASFKKKYPELPKLLGEKLCRTGQNVPHILVEADGCTIVSFPTKPRSAWVKYQNELVSHMKDKFVLPINVPGWMVRSSPSLIEQSALTLKEITEKKKWRKVALPPPGCGNGGLNWENAVKPLLETIFDDRFIICFL